MTSNHQPHGVGRGVPSIHAGFNLPLVFAIGAVTLLICLFWLTSRDSKTAMLASSDLGQWIIFPKPPDTTPHKAVPITALFQRSFHVDHQPASAVITLRAFRQAALIVNNRPLLLQQLSDSNWKRELSIDVTSELKAGTNWITIAVTNNLGPPALVASLRIDNVNIRSDTNWQVSLAGSSWQYAALADRPPLIIPGNPIYGRESLAHSLVRAAPFGVLIAVASFFAWFVLPRIHLFRRIFQPESAANASWWLPLAILAALGALFINNLPQIAPLFGFDRDGHLEYIDYILRNGSLPLADEGWQMYQPPLFYVLCAFLLKPFASSTASDSAILSLRFVSASFALIQVFIIFLCLRSLYPHQRWKQSVGTVFAAIVPANLYLSHHISNEGLAALFVTASIYFALQILNNPEKSIWPQMATGAFLGLALLAKFSAVIAVPIIATAIAWAVAGRRPSLVTTQTAFIWSVCKTILIVCGTCAAFCGWHYARVWHHFGKPLVGNWDPSLPFAWWQDPGFHTPSWFFHFGQCFSTPLFSSIHGFADGIYSTLWGDGL